MGRPLAYEPTEVLSRAADLFRSLGFGGASIQGIVDATGMSRFSIYDRFGSKEGLFYSALEFYVETRVRHGLLVPLREPGAALAELLELFARLRSLALRPGEPAGCLIVNASLELGGGDMRVESILADYSSALREAFLLALSNAHQKAELRPGRSLQGRAEYLVSMANAFMVLTHASRRAADDFMQAVLTELDGWRQPRPD